MRTGAVKTTVPSDSALLWRVKVGNRVSAPIAVAGRLYAAIVDEHHVACLDVRDGRTLWEFAAGGRVDSPPTWHAGRVLFGSADGWVYCLRADDGKLLWRLRAAPEERLVGAFGQLESAWPVHGSVLVHGRSVYVAAGRSSQLDGGIHLYRVRLDTTSALAKARLRGPDYTSDSVRENFQLPMGSLPDILMFDGTHIHMRTKTFDLDLKEQRGSTQLQAKGGLLESSYFKRIPWTLDGQYARLIVHDNEVAYYVRMFDSLRGLDPKVYFTPGKQGYLLFARRKLGKKGEAWQRRIPVRVRAMVLAEGGLWVAGPPDVVDPKDPLGAFEGRKGGRVLAVDPATGETLAEHALPSPPVFHGAAAASGRLYLTAEDGTIACFGRK
jgi:hypothetical protein